MHLRACLVTFALCIPVVLWTALKTPLMQILREVLVITILTRPELTLHPTLHPPPPLTTQRLGRPVTGSRAFCYAMLSCVLLVRRRYSW